MSTSFLEIIDLGNGEYALKQADSEGEPLVNIRFSKESKAYLNDSSFDIAKIMIQAGIQAVAHMNDENELTLEDKNAPQERILH